MSGLLERMAKRAHGTLDGVQPVIAPKFATAALAEGGSLAEATGPLALRAAQPREDGIERAVSEEAAESPHGMRQDDAPIATRRPRSQVRSRRGAESAIDADKSSLDLPRRAAPEADRVVAERAESGLPELRGRAAIGAGATGAVVRVTPRVVAGERAEGPWKGAGESLVAADRDERQASAAISRRSDHQAHSADSSELTDRRAEQRVQPAADSTGVDRIIGRRAAGAHASETGALHESNAEREEKTEIHISIGNVELRAPRPEARPQPAPFRPRVTLAEFLRRKEAQR